MSDFFGFKKRAIRKNLDEQVDCKKNAKYIRNIHRLKKYIQEENIGGTSLQKRYLEQEGFAPLQTIEDCDLLIEVLSNVEH